MSEFTKENSQRVRLEIKAKFCISLLREHITVGGKVNMDKHNQALSNLLISMGGETVIAHVTEDGRIAVNGDAFGYDGYIMLEWDFINLENIDPMDIGYVTGAMYVMQDADDTKGFFVGVEFDKESKGIVYKIMNTEKGLIRGRVMIELNDEELDAYGLGDRFSYYPKGEK